MRSRLDSAEITDLFEHLHDRELRTGRGRRDAPSSFVKRRLSV